MKKIYIGDNINWKGDEVFTRFNCMKAWAGVNCKSFTDMHVCDVSDVSMEHDYVAEFTFGDDEDMMLFILRWQG